MIGSTAKPGLNRSIQEAQVSALLLQLAHDLLPPDISVYLDLHPRTLSDERSDGRWQHDPCKVGRRCKREKASATVPEFRRTTVNGGPLCCQTLDMGQQHTGFSSRTDPAGAPFEQGEAQLILHFFQRLAHGRLRDAQEAGALG